MRIIFGVLGALFMLFVHSCEVMNESTLPVDSIEGSWLVKEESSYFKSTTTTTYRVYISLAADSTTFFIDNFYQIGWGSSAIGYIDGDRLVLEPDQEVAAGFGSFIIKEGSGRFTNNFEQIQWSYSIDDGSGVFDEVTAIYSRD